MGVYLLERVQLLSGYTTEESDILSPNNSTMPVVPRRGAGRFLHPWWMLMGLILCMSRAVNHSCTRVMNAIALPIQRHLCSPSSYPLVLTFFLPYVWDSSWVLDEVIAVLFRVNHFMNTYCQHFGKIQVSTLTVPRISSDEGGTHH